MLEASGFVEGRGRLTTIVKIAAEDGRREGFYAKKRGEALGFPPLEPHASCWRRRAAYGEVTVVPSPVAVMENVPAVLDV